MHSLNDTNLQPAQSKSGDFDALAEALGMPDSFQIAVCSCEGTLFHLVPGRGWFCADCLTPFSQQ